MKTSMSIEWGTVESFVTGAAVEVLSGNGCTGATGGAGFAGRGFLGGTCTGAEAAWKGRAGFCIAGFAGAACTGAVEALGVAGKVDAGLGLGERVVAGWGRAGCTIADLGEAGCTDAGSGGAGFTGTVGDVAGSVDGDFTGGVCAGVVTICAGCDAGEIAGSSRAQAKVGNIKSTSQPQKRNNLAIIFKNLRATY